MNRLTLGLGILVVLFLFAALLGPFFVDWTRYKETFEQRATQLIGQDVQVLGETSLSLLPAPRVVFSNVQVGPVTQDGPMASVARFEARMSLAPLLRGEFDLLNLSFFRPIIRADMSDDGTILSLRGFDASQLDPARILLRNGTIAEGTFLAVNAASGERLVTLNDVNASFSAASLLGPWKLDGSARINNGEPVFISAATGRISEQGRLRVTTDLTPSDTPVRSRLEGTLALNDAEPVFEGLMRVNYAPETPEQAAGARIDDDQVSPPSVSAQAQGSLFASVPYQLESATRITPQGLRATDMVWRFGSGENTVEFLGHADWSWRSGEGFEAVLSSRQMDIDRLLGGGPEDPVAVDQAVKELNSLLSQAQFPAIDGALYVDVPSLVIGGGVLRAVGFDLLSPGDGSLRIDGLTALLPGGSDLRGSGLIKAEREGASNRFEGVMRLIADRPQTLFAWWTQDRSLGSLNLPLLDVSGRVLMSDNQVSLEDLNGTIDETPFDGSAQFNRQGDDGWSLDTRLAAARLDVELLRAITQIVAPDAASTKARLTRLNASLSAADLTVDNVSVGRARSDLVWSNDILNIRDFAIDNGAAGQVSLRGDLRLKDGAPQGAFDGILKASDLNSYIASLRQILPQQDAIWEEISDRSPALSPVDVTFRAQANAQDGRASGLTVTVDGLLAETEMAFSADVPIGAIDVAGSDQEKPAYMRNLTLDAENPSTLALLAQFGLPVVGLGQDAPAKLELNFDAISAVDVGGQAILQSDLLAIDAEGRWAFAGDDIPAEARASTDMLLEASGRSLRDLALQAGVALPERTDADFQLRSHIRKAQDDQPYSFEEMSAAIGDFSFTGQVNWMPKLSGHMIDGLVSLTPFDLQDLAATLSGTGWAQTGEGGRVVWSRERLQLLKPDLGDGRPVDLSLRVETPTVSVTRDLPWRNVRGLLSHRAGRWTIEDMSGAFAGGQLTLGGSLFGLAPTVGLQLNAQLDDASAADLSWTSEGRPLVQGRLNASLSVEGAGQSAAGMAGSLGGSGDIAIDDVVVQNLNADAFQRVLDAGLAGVIESEAEVAENLASGLSTGSLNVSGLDIPLRIAAGAVRIDNASMEGNGGSLTGSATLDLAGWTLDATMRYAPTQAAFGLSTSDDADRPVAVIAAAGPLHAPETRVSADALTNLIQLRRLEAEVQRVETFNADVSERESLLRYMASISATREALLTARQAQQEEQERLDEERRESERQQQENSALEPIEEPASSLQVQPSALPSPGQQTTQPQPNASPPASPDISAPPQAPETQPEPQAQEQITTLPPLDQPIVVPQAVAPPAQLQPQIIRPSQVPRQTTQPTIRRAPRIGNDLDRALGN